MELIEAVIATGACRTRADARNLIAQGAVKVYDVRQTVDHIGSRLQPGQIVTVGKSRQYIVPPTA